MTTAWESAVASALFEAAAEQAGVTVDEVKGRSRAGVRSIARQAVWYVMRHRCHMTLTQMGEFTGRDHSTVSAGIVSITARLKARDDEVQEMVAAVSDAVPRRAGAHNRLSDAYALLDTAERLAPVIEALGHALAGMGERLAETVEDTRRALESVESIERRAS